MKMKLISKARVDAAREHPQVYWNGGPPSTDDPEMAEGVKVYAERLDEFFDQFASSMSLDFSRKFVGMAREEFAALMARSPWFIERINAIIDEKTAELWIASLQRSIGYAREDDNGKIKLDANGAVVRHGASDNMAKYFLDLSIDRSPVAPTGDYPGPLLPSNIDQHRQLQIDDCRMALDALRPAVRAGDRQAADSFVKIHDRLAKLSGTDAPKQSVTYIGGSDAMARLSDEQLEAIAHRGLDLVPDANGVYGPEADE